MEGQLRRIYKDMRYGFIRHDGKDYFFHKDDFDGDWTCLCRDLESGNVYLTFEPTQSDKGARARSVKLLDY